MLVCATVKCFISFKFKLIIKPMPIVNGMRESVTGLKINSKFKLEVKLMAQQSSLAMTVYCMR